MTEPVPTKTCKMCGITKLETEFYLDRSCGCRKSYCRACNTVRARERRPFESQEVKQRQAIAARRWKEKNRAHVRQKTRERRAWLKAHPELDVGKERERRQNRERVRKYRATNPQVKIASLLRCRVASALRASGGRKSAHTMELLGCSACELKQYLENLFSPGMSWDNHGRGIGKWHIDHIYPCASFDLTNPEQQRRCFHYTNLQPLWSVENHRKSAMLPEEWETRKSSFMTKEAA